MNAVPAHPVHSLPFRPVPYETLPALPRVAHPFFEAKEERITLRTAHFATTTLSVRRYGRGAKKLLCVHGLMTSGYSFRYLLERLGDDFELWVPDLPGAGRSKAPDVDYGPEHLADLLAALIRELGLQGASVVGNSMGGYLCMVLALRHPSLLGRLVNLHSPGLVTARMRALSLVLGGLPLADDLLDVLVAKDPRGWAFRNVHYYDESLKSREEVEEYSAPLQTRAGRKAFMRYLRETLSVRGMRSFERELRERRESSRAFPVPLRLVYARKDPMVPPSIGPRLAALVPGSTLAWIERGSHFAHVDAPDDFVAATRDFLLG